ncbi:HIT family protein, partial [Aquisalimonas sp.]|uniref:HIT family protein n=1 Tax=Aquisalimonas sp. TaxID=1872621 RepID=UPI0025BEE512
PKEELQSFMAPVQDVTRAIQAAIQPDGIVLNQFNGKAAGQTVFHYHQHIVPRWQGQDRRSHGKDQADPEELKSVAAAIRAELDWER